MSSPVGARRLEPFACRDVERSLIRRALHWLRELV